MESENVQDVQYQMLAWLNSCEWRDKYAFFRKMLTTLPPKEVKTLENMCNKERRANKRKLFHPNQGSKTQKVEPVPVKESVPSSGPPIVLSKPATEIQVGWWKDWSSKEIVSFDCEHVHLKNTTGTDRIKAGTVAVYNSARELLYEAKAHHAPGTFIINKFTEAKNGFNDLSFVDGRPMEDITKDLDILFTGKLVLHFDGIKDFMSLGLNAGDFDNFDLSSYYRRPLYNKYGKNIGEKLSLRTLCFNFFGVDIQAGIHSCKTDALATMRLFLRHYTQTVVDKLNKNFTNFELFKAIEKYDP